MESRIGVGTIAEKVFRALRVTHFISSAGERVLKRSVCSLEWLYAIDALLICISANLYCVYICVPRAKLLAQSPTNGKTADPTVWLDRLAVIFR